MNTQSARVITDAPNRPKMSKGSLQGNARPNCPLDLEVPTTRRAPEIGLKSKRIEIPQYREVAHVPTAQLSKTTHYERAPEIGFKCQWVTYRNKHPNRP